MVLSPTRRPCCGGIGSFWGEPMAVLFQRTFSMDMSTPISMVVKPCTRPSRLPWRRGSQGYSKSESARTPLPTISSTNEPRTAAAPISCLVCISSLACLAASSTQISFGSSFSNQHFKFAIRSREREQASSFDSSPSFALHCAYLFFYHSYNFQLTPEASHPGGALTFLFSFLLASRAFLFLSHDADLWSISGRAAGRQC